MRRKLQVIGLVLLSLAFGYVYLAWMTFQWANPKANEMSFFRDFMSVMTWQVMEEYQ